MVKAKSQIFRSWKKSSHHNKTFENWKEFEMQLRKYKTINAVQISQEKTFEK